MRDSAYQQQSFAQAPQLPHHYGPQVRLLACPVSLYQLACLSDENTREPRITPLVRSLYQQLMLFVLRAAWPLAEVAVTTRMRPQEARGVWRGMATSASEPVVVVDIARAGTVPAQTLYDLLGGLFDPALIRQDHIVMARTTDASGQVTGARVQAQKVDGAAALATVLIPDPMGATGSTLARVVQLYKEHRDGAPKRIIALHLIITPEYIKHMAALHPDVEIWALRLDRGMSSEHILGTTLGQHPDEERGLNERQYIIPGAGGMGELLNNTRG